MSLQLTVVTQEKELLSQEVDSVTAMTMSGEVTILPGHVPLMTKLTDTELVYRKSGKVSSLAVSGGFMNVEPNNKIIILADSAIRSEDINEAKAEEARKKAQETMQNEKASKTEIFLAESEMKRAILELRVAQKRRAH